MTNCPVCNSKVDEKAKFCAECGVQLANAPSERAWIVAMQEKIRTARHNDNLFIAVAVVGILITVLVPYITHFVRYNNMDTVSWSLTAVGIVLFIGSALGIMNDNNNIKELIRQLGKGQEETEGDEDEDEKEDKG